MMGDYGRIGDTAAGVFTFLIVVGVPLALWKFFDICRWVFQHLHVGWAP